jgi:hypothetical protein
MQTQHERNKLVDPLTVKFKDFPVESEYLGASVPRKKLKISEWNDKAVMLPILGKNKTSILHSVT